MNTTTVAFLDESTLHYCPLLQVLQILAIHGYDYFVEEETLDGVRSIQNGHWIEEPLSKGEIIEHRICGLEEIRLVNRVEKKCGASRSEIASRVAAKSQNAIVIARDPLAHELLQRHIPGVETVEPTTFLEAHQLSMGDTISSSPLSNLVRVAEKVAFRGNLL